MNLYKNIAILILIGLLLVQIIHQKTKVHKIRVIHARSKQEIKTGLMFVNEKLPKDHGMLFHIDYSIPSFWMKNTHIPLDIIFLTKDMKIIGISSNNAPLSEKRIKFNKPSSYVLEMNGGWSIRNKLKIGDKIEILK